MDFEGKNHYSLDMTKVLYLIAGANGSGKSTLAMELLSNEGITILNADDLARQICPENMNAARIEAGKQVFRALDNLIQTEKSFALETTLAGNNHLKTIQKAKKAGYQIALFYAFLDNPQMCINRIRVRVEKGGHFVPDADVVRRYARSLFNFWYKYKDVVNSWAIYYNGGDKYAPVAHCNGGQLDILDENLYNLLLKEIPHEE